MKRLTLLILTLSVILITLSGCVPMDKWKYYDRSPVFYVGIAGEARTGTLYTKPNPYNPELPLYVYERFCIRLDRTTYKVYGIVWTLKDEYKGAQKRCFDDGVEEEHAREVY